MDSVSTVPPLTNQSQHINASLAHDLSAGSAKYSHPELMLLGVAMAILILVIVFGKLLKFHLSFMIS